MGNFKLDTECGYIDLPYMHRYRPVSSLFAPNIVLSILIPWFVNMILMGIVLVYQHDHENHVDMQPELGRKVGYWELGDTWESTVFMVYQVYPLIWCGVCYSLGTKFRRTVFTNYPVLIVSPKLAIKGLAVKTHVAQFDNFLVPSARFATNAAPRSTQHRTQVWAVIFTIYTIVLLSPANKMTAFFHMASNPFNGLETGSPIWMRWQFPHGCPSDDYSTITNNSMLVYNHSVGLLGPFKYRDDVPDNCVEINLSAKNCGERCDSQPFDQTGLPTPGMSDEMRGVIFLTLIIGMIFMMAWEHLMNYIFIKPTDWEHDEYGKCKQTAPSSSLCARCRV